METESFTKYEVARILGARALQIAMDAPLLVKIEKEELEQIRYDPLRIAELEFSSNVLPITVKRPLPRKIEEKLKREPVKKEVKEEKVDKEVEKREKYEEKEIKAEGEIMELAQPEDEVEEQEEAEETIEE